VGRCCLALGSGAWAFVFPRSFYDHVATFEPYNRDFLHDIGAFTIGLGAVMLLALVLEDGPPIVRPRAAVSRRPPDDRSRRERDATESRRRLNPSGKPPP
jgi:hypothetical protein